MLKLQAKQVPAWSTKQSCLANQQSGHFTAILVTDISWFIGIEKAILHPTRTPERTTLRQVTVSSYILLWVCLSGRLDGVQERWGLDWKVTFPHYSKSVCQLKVNLKHCRGCDDMVSTSKCQLEELHWWLLFLAFSFKRLFSGQGVGGKWWQWLPDPPFMRGAASVAPHLGGEQAWTSTLYLKSFVDSVQVGKAVFVKESYTTLGIEPRSYSYLGSLLA